MFRDRSLERVGVRLRPSIIARSAGGNPTLGERGARDEGESERPGLTHVRSQTGPFVGGARGGESVDGRIRPNAASLGSQCFHGGGAIDLAYCVAGCTRCSARDSSRSTVNLIHGHAGFWVGVYLAIRLVITNQEFPRVDARLEQVDASGREGLEIIPIGKIKRT